MSTSLKKTLMDAEQVAESLERIARETLTAHSETENLCLVGIRTGGAFLAKRLQKLLEQESGHPIPTGIIDITLYRDDWTLIAPKPIVGKTTLDFSIDDKLIVLVDDVLFTGRTVRAAMDALMDFGRPAKIELAVLVDRGQRELPICANYTGLSLKVSRQERINVYLAEAGYQDEVAVESQS
ncbi:MAG: bifunctional pyr operon transcriptional regulator/uracil phosphoribosyltransferase PyrR [Deltaproteobacteria bacterium]|nr:bifunctional pyr operon transcriptional regulator/uracil phosphoribosyltransferase PyrR [Deltaproteobacteria bacterium]